MFYDSTRNTTAQVSFNTDLVIKCCEKFITEHEDNIQKSIERHIKHLMAPDTRTFFQQYILRYPPPCKTREEAIERIKEQPKEFLSYSIWDRIHWRDEDRFHLVKKILHMAQNTTMPFVVLNESGQFILNYKE